MIGKRVLLGLIIVSLFYLLFGTCSLGTDIETLRGRIQKGGGQGPGNPSYIVSFESNGGSYVSSQTVDSGDRAYRPTDPTRSGYTFDDWYSDPWLTTMYNFYSEVTEDITLYAGWMEVVTVNIEMVYVPGGSFQMGNELGTAGDGDVTPVHTVTLSGFYIGKYQVTQAQHQAVMGSNPSSSYGVGNNYPVYNVNWYDAIEFCNALSLKEGLSPYYTIDKVNKDPNNTNDYDSYKWTITRNSTANGYRLPTEAQWEYAAKGGNGTPGNYTYSGSNTVGDVAWYWGNIPSQISGNPGYGTQPVGTKAPNGLGIYDIPGNVWEWCWDWYGSYSSEAQTNPVGSASGDYRVVRGGSWRNNASNACSVGRGDYDPVIRGNFIGFRLVRPSETTISSFTVNFESNGGNSVTSQTINSGGTATRPTNPTRSGYTFDDWYSNVGLTTVYNFSTAVTSNITLYAKWIAVVAVNIEMVYVPSGSFEMGKELGTAGSGDNTPVHTVTLTGFYMGKYQVTQAQYQAVMGTNPSYFSSNPASGDVQGNRPVEQVSWYDAIEFCNALSIKEGLSPYYSIDKVNKDPNNTNSWDDMKWTVTRNSTANGYRLPTEAQWEYAAKGGNGTPGNYTYSWSNTVGDVAWYWENSNSITHEVGKKQPNGLGIYDMSGNVWEWCWDWYGSYSSGAQTDPQGAASGDFRVVRGGSWYDVASSTRSVLRSYDNPYGRRYDVGFRLVRP